MKETTFKQKVGLIVFGLCVFFVLIEIVLRLGGFIATVVQEHKNKAALSKKSDYCILCLGESTTAGEWPPHLEGILNSFNIGKTFTVIDKGRNGTNTAFVLAHLKEYLDKYNPDMVITMIGINDGIDTVKYADHILAKSILFFQDFRVYKLIKLLYTHVTYKIAQLGTAYASTDDNVEDFIAKDDTSSRILNEDVEEFYNVKPRRVKEEVTKKPKVKPYSKLGHDYMQEGEYQKAEMMYKKAIPINFEDLYPYFDLGRLYIIQGKYDQAEEILKAAIEADPNQGEGYIRLGECYKAQEKYEEACAMLEKGIQLGSDDTGNYMDLAVCNRKRGKVEEAIDILVKLKEMNVHEERVYLKLGWSYIEQQRYEEAEKIFEEAAVLFEDEIKRKQKSIYVYLDLGWLYLHERKYKKAEEILKLTIDIDPTIAEAYARLGRCYMAQGLYDKASGMFEEAVKLNPEDTRNYVDLALCYGDLGKLDEKLDILLKALKINPNGDNIYCELGWHYEYLGKLDKAEEIYKKALVINPKNAKAAHHLYLLYVQLKRFDDIDAVISVMEEPPISGGFRDAREDIRYSILGGYHAIRQEYEAAEGIYKKAMKQNPTDGRWYASLALCYFNQGKYELASMYFDRAKELRLKYVNPSTHHNYNAIKRIVLKRGISLVCVQYPLRSIEPLKNLLYPNKGIIFVDNEKLFKMAIKDSKYDEYFRDNFAGDFGHCSDRGNKLLAENIAHVILEKCFNKSFK